MDEQNSKRTHVRFFWGFNYFGSADISGFNLYRLNRGRPQHPRIHGVVKASSPTTVDLTIVPHYFSLISGFVLGFIFMVVVMTTDGMMLNGQMVTPTPNQRLLFGSLGIGLPALYYLFNALIPIRSAAAWLTKNLKLQER